MKCKVGDAVRTLHGSIGVSGVVLSRADDSLVDGSERWLVRWTLPDGSHAESRWSPETLVPLDTPRESDPPVVLVGISSDGKLKTWLTRKGIIRTPATTTLDEMLLADATAFDAVFADRPDR